MLSLVAAGCSSSSSLFGPSGSSSGAGSSPDFGDRVASFFGTGGSSRPQQAAGEPPPPEEIDCPSVTVRPGASTLTVHASPREQTAMTLRYQGTISRTARECRIAAGTVHMRVGVEGRIILGPAGSPGNLDVPLRFAVVREGTKPVTIVTRDYRVPVTIEAGSTNVPFVQIDEDLTFPMPPAAELNGYVVYVGYDPEAPKRPQPRRRGGTAKR